MCDLDVQRSTANAGERAGRIYPQPLFLLNNTEKISVDWESERGDIFPFQVATTILST